MSPPEPRINTFFQKTKQPIVDPISKVFIIASLILGVNRLPIIGINNTVCIVLMTIYTTFINALIFFLAIDRIHQSDIWAFLTIIDCIQYLICTVLGFVLHKRLANFYLNLNKFDKGIGIKVTKFGIRESVYNFLQLIVTLLQSSMLTYADRNNMAIILQIISKKMLNCLELHYYGHLFSLMIPSLKAMSDCMKSSYPYKVNRTKLAEPTGDEMQKEDKKSHLDMNKLMDFYNNIIVAYDCLNEAVKWQMLTVLISSFSSSLIVLYHAVKIIIWGDVETHGLLVVSISIIVILLFPLLVPCVFADRVQREVRLIKDFLVCKLYENTLDKPNRGTARTLLALIETRNLSFSLFHMFDIDISLPFKFMALLLTYLIILLQFDKVISPTKSA